MQPISKYIVFFMMFSGLAFGQSVNINGQKVDVGQEDLVFRVKGLVCSFCAHGLQKGLSKLKFVDKKKYTKGIHTDINHQYVVVGLKKGEEINVDDAIDVITDAGYEVSKFYTNPSGSELKVTERKKDAK